MATAAVIQRPLRGSRISSFYPVKSLPSLSSLDSAFQLQEYISLLIRLDVHDVDAIVSLPGKESNNNASATQETTMEEMKSEDKDGEKDRKGDVTVDEACWIYEQLRRLAQDLSHPLITMLQQECSRATCPEMKAGEWLYLCVAHGNDGAMESCCAIDYILHTLDSATALLNSPRAFPSRLSIPQTSHRHFSSLARRLGRIFAHAYFHHREAFEQAEAESSLYARFLALTSRFDLVPAEFLVIPPRVPYDDERDVSPPRLHAAAVDRSLHPGVGGTGAGDPEPQWEERGQERSPARDGAESPRKMGRNRTDTMVYSEAFSVAGELAKPEPEADDTEDGVEDDGLERDPFADNESEGAAIEGALGAEDTGVVLESAEPAHAPETASPAAVEHEQTPASGSSPTALRTLPEPVSNMADAQSLPDADSPAVEPLSATSAPDAQKEAELSTEPHVTTQEEPATSEHVSAVEVTPEKATEAPSSSTEATVESLAEAPAAGVGTPPAPTSEHSAPAEAPKPAEDPKPAEEANSTEETKPSET